MKTKYIDCDDCGINWHREGKTGYIDYCKLHRIAPELLYIVKRIAEGEYGPGLTHDALKAIAKAEGDTK